VFILAGSAFLILLLLNSSSTIEKPHNIQVAYQDDMNSASKEVQGVDAANLFIPSSSPTPTKAPIPTEMQKVKPTNPPANDIGLNILKQINEFRASNGLSPFSTDGFTCSLAVARASEIVNDFSHDKFKSRIDSKTLPYPGYSSVAENLAQNSDPNAVVGGWINSPGHNENMRKDAPFACVAKNGVHYALEIWKP